MRRRQGAYLKFTKEYSLNGSGWAWSFDPSAYKWHDIDDNGIVRYPLFAACPHTDAMLPARSPVVCMLCRSLAASSSAPGWPIRM